MNPDYKEIGKNIRLMRIRPDTVSVKVNLLSV